MSATTWQEELAALRPYLIKVCALRTMFGPDNIEDIVGRAILECLLREFDPSKAQLRSWAVTTLRWTIHAYRKEIAPVTQRGLPRCKVESFDAPDFFGRRQEPVDVREPFREIEDQMVEDLLWEAAKGLPERQYEVWRLRVNGSTFQGIASTLCISESRAYKLWNRAAQRVGEIFFEEAV